MVAFNNNSEFAKSLNRLTGTVLHSGDSPSNESVGLVYGDVNGGSSISENNPLLYLNSGVALDKRFSPALFGHESVGLGIEGFFKIGPRFSLTRLNMPANYYLNKPHCHPGGEIAVVLKGSYADVDTTDEAIRVYGEGDVVVYQAGSTHRPVSNTGSEIFYIPMNGIVFADDPRDLLLKMASKKISSREGIEYAAMWMVKGEKLRDEILRDAGFFDMED